MTSNWQNSFWKEWDSRFKRMYKLENMAIYRRGDLINCRDVLERSPRDGVIEGRLRACVVVWASPEHGFYMFFRILYMRGCSPLFDQGSYGSIGQWRYAFKRDLGHHFLSPSSLLPGCWDECISHAPIIATWFLHSRPKTPGLPDLRLEPLQLS